MRLTMYLRPSRRKITASANIDTGPTRQLSTSESASERKPRATAASPARPSAAQDLAKAHVVLRAREIAVDRNLLVLDERDALRRRAWAALARVPGLRELEQTDQIKHMVHWPLLTRRRQS
jgi:hypothetical protein